MKPQTYGYARISTEEQFSSHLSLDEQRRQIKEFCRKNSYDLGPDDCRLGEEQISAFKMRFADRPLGKKLNASLQRGDHVVIAKVDRAFRDMKDAFVTIEDWDRRGVVYHILDSPVNGHPIFERLILGVLSWCAEFESHRRGERMRDAWRSAKRRGQHMGLSHAPWGFRWIGSKKLRTAVLEYFPEEREVMSLVWDLYWDEEMAVQAITGHLIRNRIVPFDRRPPWAQKTKYRPAEVYHARYVREMLRSESELLYYEEAGLSPEEAAAQWLTDFRQDRLPDQETVLERLSKGEPVA